MCAVSFNPDDAIKGGLFTDVDGTLENCHLGEFTYPNSGDTTFAFLADMAFDDGTKEQVMWSIGDVKAWRSEDGNVLDGVNNQTGLPDTSNFLFLLREMVSAGFPKAKIDNKADTFNNLKAHWIRKAQPQRSGITQSSDRERTLLVPSTILAGGLPWERNGAAAGGATKKVSGGKSTAAKTSSNDLENEKAVPVAGAVLEAMIGNAKLDRVKNSAGWGIAVLSEPLKVAEYKALDAGDKETVKRLLKNAEFLGTMGVTVDDKGGVTLPTV